MLSLSRYRSDRFCYRVIDIEVADLDKRYRIIVIEVGVKLSNAHHCDFDILIFRSIMHFRKLWTGWAVNFFFRISFCFYVRIVFSDPKRSILDGGSMHFRQKCKNRSP